MKTYHGDFAYSEQDDEGKELQLEAAIDLKILPLTSTT